MKLWDVQELEIIILLFNESGGINLTWGTFKKILLIEAPRKNPSFYSSFFSQTAAYLEGWRIFCTIGCAPGIARTKGISWSFLKYFKHTYLFIEINNLVHMHRSPWRWALHDMIYYPETAPLPHLQCRIGAGR